MSDRLLRHCLSLAAAPVFAAMALSTRGGEMPGMDMPASSPLNGMALMYLLMAVFHASPWLKLFSDLRKARCALVETP